MSGLNLSALAVRERAVTLFLIIAIMLAGAYAFFQLGRAEDPPFTVKTLTVSAVWPGATAQEMQDLVAEPLEKRMQELRWYDRVETFTRPGLMLMSVTLKDTTPPSQVPEQFYQARKKLGDEQRKLPAGVLGPFINDEYSDVTFAVYAVKAKGMPPRALTREAGRCDNVCACRASRGRHLRRRRARIFVEFSNKLATLGISARSIFDALNRQNVITPAGSIETSGPQVFVRVEGAYDDLQKIRDTPITAGGRVLKLSDIAEVKRGYEDPATFLIRHDGDPAMVLGIVMQDGWNGLELDQALDREEKQLHAELPAGLSFTKVTDQAVNIRESVDVFMLKFFVALTVVMIVGFASLGWRGGIWSRAVRCRFTPFS
jgi:multidrug efflux pump subunit AcrB